MKNLLALLLLFACLLCHIRLPAQRQRDKPNVLIIFIDDLGYGDLSAYGNPQIKTRVIDSLAQQGTMFSQFYANSPVCSPSRVAMLTGQYPARHQFYTYLAGREKNEENRMPDFLPASVFTLAKGLQANGYATGHFGKWHLGGGRDVGDAPLPTEYGFDKSFTSFEGLGDRTLTFADGLNKQSARLGRGHIVKAPQHEQTRIYVDSALAFVRANKDKPFLINFFPNDVHDPYNPEQGSEKVFANVDPDTIQQKFLATLKNLDKEIGRLLGSLRDMHLLENTIVLFTSDNGPTDWPYYYKDGGEPPCSQGDLRGRKWSLYEGGIRVPFIAVWPGKIPAGQVNAEAVMSVADIVPTIASLTGTTLPASYRPDGIDESAVLLGRSSNKAHELFWYYNNEPLPGKPAHISPMLAMRSGNWKLLMEPDGSKLQLYNIASDPLESVDLATREMRKANELKTKLKQWYDSVVNTHGNLPSRTDR